jgi:uncharacterized lipoprotein
MKNLMLLVTMLLLSGCAARPTNMIFSPQDVHSMALIYHGQSYKVAVLDNRNAKHLLKVIDTDGKKQHHQASNSITTKLAESLTSRLSKQGLTISTNVPSTIELSIVQLETVVAQHSLKYDASFAVEFKVTIKRDNRTFYKTFTGHSTREGVLDFDIARMEADLNQLVTTVLADIFNDQYLIQSIKA